MMRTMNDEKKLLTFRYDIKFSNGLQKIFVINLDSETLELVTDHKLAVPEWTKLSVTSCPKCNLDLSRYDYCPVAANLAELVDSFKEYYSFEEVDVIVETTERNYFKHSTLQKVVSSLMGIYMVTSGCPVLDKMRLLVRTHLPFPTPEESAFRLTSLYLFAQYVLEKNGQEVNWDLRGLLEFYKDVEAVNKNFCMRLNTVQFEDKDVSVNAVNILNVLGTLATISIRENE